MARIAAAGMNGEFTRQAENAGTFTFFEITDDFRINGMFEESVCGEDEKIIVHFLVARNVSVLVCDRISESLKKQLADSGIVCAEGCGGSIISAVGDYLMKRIINH